VSALKRGSREKRQTSAEIRKKIETSTEQSSLYGCLFAVLSVRDRRGDKGVSDSSVSPPIKTMHHFTH
jgi:hypothetical protein